MEQLLSLIRLLPATLSTAGSLLPALSDAAPKVGGGAFTAWLAVAGCAQARRKSGHAHEAVSFPAIHVCYTRPLGTHSTPLRASLFPAQSCSHRGPHSETSPFT